MSKNLEIERLRALAALLTVNTHTVYTLGNLVPVLTTTPSGVDLFFVISGFVVTLSLLRLLPDLSKCDSLGGRARAALDSLKIFYLRRIFRILPPALFFIIFTCGVIYLCKWTGITPPEEPDALLREAISFLSGTYNYARAIVGVTGQLGNYWSLSVEEHFYLLMPLLFIVFPTRSQRIIAVCGGIAAVVLLIRGLIGAQNTTLSHVRFDGLFIGVLLALVYSATAQPTRPSPSIVVDFTTWHRVGIRFGKLVLPVLLAFILASMPTITHWEADYNRQAGHLSYALLSAGLIHLASRQTGWIFDVPYLRRFLEYIGSRSYAIYLCHDITMDAFKRLLSRNWNDLPIWFTLHPGGVLLQAFVILGAVILVAEIAYQFVELPFISLGGRVIHRNFGFKTPETRGAGLVGRVSLAVAGIALFLVIFRGFTISTDRHQHLTYEEQLRIAARFGFNRNVEFLLFEKGANANAAAEDGMTALMAAAGAGQTVNVTSLLQKGANTNVKTTRNETALYLATVNNHPKVVKMLLDKVDPEASQQAVRSYEAAKERSFKEIAAMLKPLAKVK